MSGEGWGGREKVARRKGEVCLSHSGSVGVCLSSPLSREQQRGSERVLFPSIMYNTPSKHTPIYSGAGRRCAVHFSASLN